MVGMGANPYESPLTPADSSLARWRYWAAIGIHGLSAFMGIFAACVTMAGLSNLLQPFLLATPVSMLLVGGSVLIACYMPMHIGGRLAKRIWPPRDDESP